MRFQRTAHHGLFLLSLLLLAINAPCARAQEDDAVAIVEAHSTVAAGDVFEILGVSGTVEGQFEWVLTSNGSFVEAGRERMFRTRLLQEGSYILDGQFGTEAELQRLHLTIGVTAPREGRPEESPPAGLQIVTTDIPSENNTVRLRPESPLVTLTPEPAWTGAIAGDLDTRTDSDGDGDPGNDNDLGDTLFATEHNPLRLWFASGQETVLLALSTDAEDGTPIRQDLLVTSGSQPVPIGNIGMSEEQEGEVSFSFPLDAGIDPATVVYQWYFGDGWQSLEDAPTHVFARNDDFDVHVIVRELSTGHVVAEGEGTVSITGVQDVVTGNVSSGSASSAVSSSKPTPTPTPSSGSGSFLWTLVKILGLLLVAGVIGAGGVWVFRKFLHREGALQRALEQAETALIKKPGAPEAAATAEPAALELKRPVKTESAQAPMELKPTPAPAPPSPSAPAPATPAWLQKGLAAAEEKEKQAPQSPAALSPPAMDATSPPALPGDQFPTEAVKEAPAAALPSPSPVSPAPTPLVPEDAEHPLSEDDLLPPWLREEGETKATGVTEATKVAEAPVPPAASAPPPLTPTPVPTPAPLPTSPPTEMPPWLGGPDTAAAIAPAAATPPKSEPLAPPVPAPALEPPVPLPAPPPPAPAAETPQFPEALPPPPATPALTIPAPTTVINPEDQAQLERERERKRRKRQRYRENLKKRKMEEGNGQPSTSGTGPGSGTGTSQTSHTTGNGASATGPAAKALSPPVQAKAPAAPVAPLPPKPAPMPTAEPKPQQKPVVQDIPKQETPPAQSPAPADDKIAFMIKAEGIEKKNGKQKKGSDERGKTQS